MCRGVQWRSVRFSGPGRRELRVREADELFLLSLFRDEVTAGDRYR